MLALAINAYNESRLFEGPIQTYLGTQNESAGMMSCGSNSWFLPSSEFYLVVPPPPPPQSAGHVCAFSQERAQYPSPHRWQDAADCCCSTILLSVVLAAPNPIETAAKATAISVALRNVIFPPFYRNVVTLVRRELIGGGSSEQNCSL